MDFCNNSSQKAIMERENTKIINEFFQKQPHLTHEFGLYLEEVDEFTTLDDITDNDFMHRFQRESILKNATMWRKLLKDQLKADKIDRSCYQYHLEQLDNSSRDFAAKLTNFKRRYQGKQQRRGLFSSYIN